MKGLPIAGRRGPFLSQFLVLHSDRIEQLSLSAFGLEVRKLFFDELTCATVQRQFAAWIEIAVWAVLGLLGVPALGLGVWLRSWPAIALGAFALLGLLALVLAAWFEPPYLLVLRAGDQALRGSLPRRAAAREEALRRLRDNVERYQRLRDPARSAAAAPSRTEASPDGTLDAS